VCCTVICTATASYEEYDTCVICSVTASLKSLLNRRYLFLNSICKQLYSDDDLCLLLFFRVMYDDADSC